ncbi:MAG: TIGR04053 family radical SAM/SPASM domain-containing protein [Chloroflexota bacterium]|nr:MAG: TIGR04053 family radical SAM/SPASM domain-containing protein [Chloroflexota bacterium]
MGDSPGPYRPARGGTFFDVDFDRSPFTVAWEITRACALACIHCRASAIPRRSASELTTEEGIDLIDQIVALGTPILVVTGGDPLMRDDVYDLLEHASGRGLRVALSPSATGRLTRPALERIKATGAQMLHLSLDGSSADVHDRFRGVHGSFDRTLARARDAVELGFVLQVGTTVSRHNVHDLEAIAERVAAARVNVWTLFFLVPTGRAQAEDMLDPLEHERVFHWLREYGRGAPFHVRTIAAQHYRRVVIEAERPDRAHQGDAPPRWEYTGTGFSASVRAGGSAMRGVNDGNGFCFVGHTGEVCPSGFLPIVAGNVRGQPLAEIYRDSSLFRALRDPTRLKGKCGACEYRAVCGGSRARAHAVTGDFLASDPSCAYVPTGHPKPAGVGELHSDTRRA